MADVGLGGVERHGVVADVLRAEEDAEGQAVQEVAGRQQPGHRTQAETRAALVFAQR